MESMNFSHVFGDYSGTIYAIALNDTFGNPGDLLWYQDLARDGTVHWAANSETVIGRGWDQVFQGLAGGIGMIYAFGPAGDLRWYQDLAQNGTVNWAANSGNVIGSGWDRFAHVFAGGIGIIYAIDS